MADDVEYRCGITLHTMRPGEPIYHIRIAAEDIAAAGKIHRKGGDKAPPLTPGLYACSQDAFDLFQPLITARLRQTQVIDDAGHALFRDAAGNVVHDSAKGVPIMTLTAEQEALGNMLL